MPCKSCAERRKRIAEMYRKTRNLVAVRLSKFDAREAVNEKPRKH